jgi:hypothetical protein
LISLSSSSSSPVLNPYFVEDAPFLIFERQRREKYGSMCVNSRGVCGWQIEVFKKDEDTQERQERHCFQEKISAAI